MAYNDNFNFSSDIFQDFVFFKPLRDNELVGKDSAEMLHTVTCSIYY